METLFEACRAVSVVAFLSYGALCLWTQHMSREFERFGLARMRKLTGGLELLGASGLIGGYFVPFVTTAASAGLALLMLLGVGVRIRVRDPFVSMLPALALLAANALVCALTIVESRR